jgi:O-antigen/teichoic acid export membrane protein
MSEGRVRSLAEQSVTYGLGGFLTRASGLVLIPVYVRYAGTSAYGVVELILAAIVLVSIVLRFGIAASMSRFTLGEGKERVDWAPVIQTIFTFVMVMASLGVLVGLIFHSFLANALQVSNRILVAGLFGLWVTMNYDVLARIYRIERRAKTWVQFSLLALTIALTLFLVVVLDEGAMGLLVGNFGGTLIVYIILVALRHETIGVRRFDRSTLRELLVFSLPLMPANVAIWALNLADRIQVQRLAGHTELGAYSVAARVAVPVLVVMAAFQNAWAPFAQDLRGQHGDERAKQTYGAVLSYWAVVMGWALVAITMIAPPYIAYALPKEAHSAEPVVALLGAGIVLYGGYLVVSIGVTISKRTQMTPLIATIAAGINLGLNFWAIPAWGIVGAGVTTVIGYAALLLMGWANAQRSYPVPYDWWRVAKVAAAVTAFIAVSEWVVPTSGVGVVAIRLLLAAAFPLALLAVGGLTRAEVRRGMQMIGNRLPRQLRVRMAR